MSVLLTLTQYISADYMGGSGTHAQAQVQQVIDLAELQVSDLLGYGAVDGNPVFVETQWVEDRPWPVLSRPMQLSHPRISSIDTVVTLHACECDCDWTEVTACAYIHEADRGTVRFKETGGCLSGCWSGCSCRPKRVRCTYTAGFEAANIAETTSVGKTLRMAIALQATSLLPLLSVHTEGATAIKSFSSMGYSEQRDYLFTAHGRKLGQSLLCQHAADLLKPLMGGGKRRAVVIRGH